MTEIQCRESWGLVVLLFEPIAPRPRKIWQNRTKYLNYQKGKGNLLGIKGNKTTQFVKAHATVLDLTIKKELSY